MFTTPEEVADLTNKSVSAEDVYRAQAIIEAYVGKSEAQIEDAGDLGNLAKATAYQTAYMQVNGDIVFEQVQVSSMGQNESVWTFKDDVAPFIAPLAKIACKNLSWTRARSVKTGPAMNNRFGMTFKEWWVRD